MLRTSTLLRSSLVLGLCLGLAGAASAAPISNFTNFEESDNMLNGGSHNREQNHATAGTQISITDAGTTTNGSASQELFGTSEFAPFTTDGYRLQVDLTNVVRNNTNERVAIMTSSAIPAGGPGSGDVRSAADYFYWAMRGGSVHAGMYSSVHGEEEGGLVGIVGGITGLYMERNGTGWDLGYINGSGSDVFVQFRDSINGKSITADGTYIGIYSDMRTDTSSYTLDNLTYTVPEPTSLALLGLGGLLVARRRRG